MPIEEIDLQIDETPIPGQVKSFLAEAEIRIDELFDTEKNRVSLGMKQLLDDPWDKIPEKLEINSNYKGTVANIADYGVFVDLGDNVEGLVRTSELNWTNKNINPNNGSFIVNEDAFSNTDGSIVIENRESGVRLGAMYTYGTAYSGGSIAAVGSGGTAFTNITGPVAVGPLDANKPLILGGGQNRYATIHASEFRINPSGLTQDFIIQGVNTDDLLYIDASTDRVGIGTSSPSLSLIHI